MTVVDIVAALDETGFEEEAERVLALTRARVGGDYLQTAAIFDEQMQVLSLVTDPNDYAGPGTGYEPTPARQREIDTIRQVMNSPGLRIAGVMSHFPTADGSDLTTTSAQRLAGGRARCLADVVRPARGRCAR